MRAHISRFLYNNNIDPFGCYAHLNIRILTARAGARNDVGTNKTTAFTRFGKTVRGGQDRDNESRLLPEIRRY